MNKTGWLFILVFMLTALAIAYRIQILLKTSYTFISISGKNGKPNYFNSVRSSSLDTYLPGLTAKAFANLQLSDILEPESLYKVITPESFDPSVKDNCVILSKLDKESHFIHAALGRQVPQIFEKFFKDSAALLLLELDQTALNNAHITLKKEQNKAGGEFFPHLYGAEKIPLAIIRDIIELQRKEGTWTVNTISLVIPSYQQT